jgi:hypothetical protein
MSSIGLRTAPAGRVRPPDRFVAGDRLRREPATEGEFGSPNKAAVVLPRRVSMYWLKRLVAALAYALALYVLVLVVAPWTLGGPFLGSVAVPGEIVCGAGGLIGSFSHSIKRKVETDRSVVGIPRF